jgi:hypothetical protein
MTAKQRASDIRGHCSSEWDDEWKDELEALAERYIREAVNEKLRLAVGLILYHRGLAASTGDPVNWEQLTTDVLSLKETPP